MAFKTKTTKEFIKAPRILFSSHTGEQYSATKGDYFMSKDSHQFKDSLGNPMQLVQTKYGELGNLEIAKVIKKKAYVRDL